MQPGEKIEKVIDDVDDALDSCLRFVQKRTRLFIKCPDLRNSNGESGEASLEAMKETQARMDEVFKKISKTKFTKKKRKARKK